VDVRAEQERARLERKLAAVEREVVRLVDAYQAEVIELAELAERRQRIAEHRRMLRAPDCPLPCDLNPDFLVLEAKARLAQRMILIRYHPHPYVGPTLEEASEFTRWRLAVKAGGMPQVQEPDEINWWYGNIISSGARGYLNYSLFHFRLLRPIFLFLWNRTKKRHPVEGVSAEYAREVKKHVSIPILNTGGYQDARLIRKVISEGHTDAVSIARPLIANNNLPRMLASGQDLPERPCSFCNRCLVNAIANPLGCYDVRRFKGDRDVMILKSSHRRWR
jgi:hypothetical protein